MVEIKHEDFVGAVPIMSSLWIMALRICREGTSHIPLSLPATIGALARLQDRRGL